MAVKGDLSVPIGDYALKFSYLSFFGIETRYTSYLDAYIIKTINTLICLGFLLVIG